MNRCQFFVHGLYAIKVVVVAYSLLAYNIDFFKIVFNAFICSYFLKKKFKRDPCREHTPILSGKFELNTTDLFSGLEQVLHNRYPTVVRVRLCHKARVIVCKTHLGTCGSSKGNLDDCYVY